MRLALAAAPPLVAVALLLLRRSPPAAATAALLAAVVAVAAADLPAGVLRAAAPGAARTAVEVALVLLGGLLLAETGRLSGVNEALVDWADRLAAGRPTLVLLLVLGVTPFAESVTGFGVGVVLAAPVLRSLGFGPSRAAVLSLLGLVAVPWGALGPGTVVGARLTGLGVDELGVMSAALSLPVFLVVGAAAVRLSGGSLRRSAVDLGVAAVALWGGLLGVGSVLGTALAGPLGGLVAVGAVTALVRLRSRRPLPPGGPLAVAARPYLVLLGLLLAARGVAAAVDDAAPPAVVAVLDSPATWLLLTAAVFLPRVAGARAEAAAAAAATVRRWTPVAVTTVLFLVVGTLLAAGGPAGPAAELARAAAGAGGAYPAVAPWVGGLGGLLTGSNVGANAMFAAAQAAAARDLGCPVLVLVGVQNVSASLLTMASAPRVALALQAAGAAPTEPGVLRPVLAVDAVALAVLSATALVLC